MKLDYAALAQRQRITRMQRRVLLALAGLGLGGQYASAGPNGANVRHGNVSVTQNGAQTTIRASQNSVIDWKSFNIGAGETTTFIQPSATSVVWNRILDQNPSQILGNLNANGFVVMINQSGFYFGKDSVVQVGGLLVSTQPMNLPGDNGGANWTYNGPPPTASIINYGKVETKNGGSLFLVAEKIENHGTLMAPDGTLGLYAGKEVLVSDSPDGRGLSVKVALPSGSIDNTGKLIADAGSIALHAQAVNNSGLIQANSVREKNGVIELVATDEINLSSTSLLQAKGGSAGTASSGGNILIKSEGKFSDADGSIVDVRGGESGGNGGSVEISAKQMPSIRSHIDGTAKPGWAGGKLLIDPVDIVFGFNTGENPDALYLNPSDDPPPFAGMSLIAYQADRDIFFSQNLNWNVANSTGVFDSGSMMTLEAGRNIIFGEGARLSGGSGWSFNFTAGGGIYLNGGPDVDGLRQNGSGSIETADGNIKFVAGTDVLVGSGFIRTTGGGSIDITAGHDVDAGTKRPSTLPDWYEYGTFGTRVSANLGGIATGAGGGNVTIHAGNDITSGPTAIGAYRDGNVTLQAGHDILGRFILWNGTGSIDAGNDVGSAASPASLALTTGGWSVRAGHDIFLNEVYNPNGSLNSSRIGGTRFRYTYADDASVLLDAANGVHLLGNNPVHTVGTTRETPYFAPKLEVHAGAGGIELGNDVVLAPSALGSLKLFTTAGGSLFSAPGNNFQLVMSDSGSPDFNTFLDGHASTPLQLAMRNDPFVADIAGDINNVVLASPKQGFIHVHGSTLNFAYRGQNLGADETTSIIVDGNINNRGNRTSVTQVTPNSQVFDPQFTINEALGNKLVYDPKTQTLSFVGKMSETERDFLLAPQIKQYDSFGNLVVDANGNPIYKTVQFIDPAKVQQLYAATQDIPDGNGLLGLRVGGPGKFFVSANNADLGITEGIRSEGSLRNPALAAISPNGANISLQLSGDLEMGASQIASFAGGSIGISAGGKVNVGSQANFTSDDTPKGITTSSGGNITLHAGGDINVNGSRIATYNGGDIAIMNEHGDINAGEGGLGFVKVERTVIDPVTGEVRAVVTTIPGSGILATVLPGSDASLGNINILAKDGDVIANKGGVLQLSFNPAAKDAPQGEPSKITIKAPNGSILANDSGIIGGDVELDAKNDIQGLVVASRDINISSQNVSVTALAGGNANVSGANVSGSTIVGGASVNVSAANISDSALVSGSVSASGAQSGVQSGVGATAAATSNSKVDDSDKTVAAATKKEDDEDEQRKRGKKTIALAKTVGRVTVILPEKK